LVPALQRLLTLLRPAGTLLRDEEPVSVSSGKKVHRIIARQG
jgi:hypothetical protein